MGLGTLAVIGIALALGIGSVAAVVTTQTGSDGGQPIDLVDVRKNDGDDDARIADEDDDDRDDPTGDGVTGEPSAASRAPQADDPNSTGDGTTVGDTTAPGARQAPAPAPAPAGTTAQRAQPAPAPAPARAPAPAPPPPVDDSHSVDTPSNSGDSSG